MYQLNNCSNPISLSFLLFLLCFILHFFLHILKFKGGGGVQPLKFPSVSTNGLNSKNYQLHKRKANTMLHSRSMWLALKIVTLQKLLSNWAWPRLTCTNGLNSKNYQLHKSIGFSKEYNVSPLIQAKSFIILQYIFSLKLFISILPVQILYCRFKILHQGKRFAKSCTVKPV